MSDEIPDKMRGFETGARRDTAEGKPCMALIPHDELERILIHYTNGAEQYGKNNWTKGMPLSELYNSSHRHLQKWWKGETDEDHLAATIWNLLGIMWTERRKPEMDDRGEFPR